MNENEIEEVMNLYNSTPEDEFSCHLCKTELQIPTCTNCPVYVQVFDDCCVFKPKY